MYDAKSLIDVQTDSMPASNPSVGKRGKNGVKPSAYRCLVADDDPNILRLVADMIAEFDFQVDTAEDGRKAFIQISSHHYDVVVTDLEMPEMNGFLLASRIKNLSSCTKTIIMTGHRHAEVTGMINSPNVDAWLFKPFGLNELYNLLEDLKFPCDWEKPAASVDR
jgi:two-component system capsular synthesis sensor histidine kinase RcsC